jgi:hypothetical protein
MKIAEQLNDTLRRLWEDCKVKKLNEIVKGIEGISNEQVLSVLQGEKNFYDTDDGGLLLEDSTPEEHLSIESVLNNFKYQYEDLTSRIVSYSFSMRENYNEDDYEGFLHYWRLLNNYTGSLTRLQENYKEFVELTGIDEIQPKEILKEVYNELKEDEDEGSYKNVNDYWLHTLNFSHLHVKNLLVLEKNYSALEIMKVTGSNGMDLLLKYKQAQREADEARGNKIFSEDIMNCIWNSGWLSPSGEFYGCPDLSHVEFTKKLVECLNISDVCDNNYDRALELDGWIKFSSGRWLYMEEDFKPSKAQLQIIFKWAHDKADDFRVYLGDEFVNLDVLQCKINSAE